MPNTQFSMLQQPLVSSPVAARHSPAGAAIAGAAATPIATRRAAATAAAATAATAAAGRLLPRWQVRASQLVSDSDPEEPFASPRAAATAAPAAAALYLRRRQQQHNVYWVYKLLMEFAAGAAGCRCCNEETQVPFLSSSCVRRQSLFRDGFAPQNFKSMIPLGPKATNPIPSSTSSLLQQQQLAAASCCCCSKGSCPRLAEPRWLSVSSRVSPFFGFFLAFLSAVSLLLRV